VFARQDIGPMGYSGKGSRVGSIKNDRLLGKLVKMRRMDMGISITAQMVLAKGIGDNQNNVHECPHTSAR
jgi:hypothetical protein